MPTVTFMPENRTLEVAEGENLLRVAMLADVSVKASCGGDGTCGKCRMIVESGGISTDATSKLSAEEVAAGYVLACKSTVTGNAVVTVPVESRPGVVPTDAGRRAPNRVLSSREHLLRLPKSASPPPVAKRAVHMNEPDHTDNMSDAARVKLGLRRSHGISDATISLPALRELPSVAREGAWTVTAFAAEPCDSMPVVSGFQAGDTTHQQFAVAVDIGTTTVEVALVDLAAGTVVAQHAEYNAQGRLGDDVISRVIAATKKDGLQELNELVVGTVKALVEQCVEDASASVEDIVCYYAAGNTVMTHLLLGITPEHIRTAPYVPATNSFPWMRAADLGLPAGRATRFIAMPCPASWLGGDIVSGVVAAGMPWTEKLTLFIDVGTNGEIVLGNSEWLVSASCSAGPAFEGRGISCGTRAALGAIEQVRIDDETYAPSIMTIGGTKPVGICGSGLIDVLSELFLSGALDRSGHLRRDTDSPYLRATDSGMEYVVVDAEMSATGRPITVTEADIDNLLRAKAAIHAGIAVLLESLDVSYSDIEEVVVAGGFGHYLDLERVMSIGMVPEIDPTRFVFLGNSSLLGATLVAGSREVLRTARRAAEMMTYLELSVNAGFMDHYLSALFLPHTNTEQFPRAEALLASRAGSKAVA